MQVVQNNPVENNIVKLRVKDLTTDHKLQLEDGSWQRIVSIGKGFFTSPSKLLAYENGKWSCLLNNDKVEAIYSPVENENHEHN